LWDVETGTTIGSALEGHSLSVNSVVFSPDGSKLASASSDNTVCLWDVETGAAIGSALKGHSSLVNSVVFSPNGSKLAFAANDNTVCLWDVDVGNLIKTKEYYDIQRCKILFFSGKLFLILSY
jgi:WD40 repeat protein